jgi:hypothetical protein
MRPAVRRARRGQKRAGDRWQDIGLVFMTQLGAALDAGNVRKMFKRRFVNEVLGN